MIYIQRYDLIIDLAPRGRTVLKVEPVITERLMVVCNKDHPRIAEHFSRAVLKKNTLQYRSGKAEKHAECRRYC